MNGGRRRRLSALVERLRANLFVVPLLAVALAIGAAWAGLFLDSHFDEPARDLPLIVASTVESARAVLSAVAGATITFAGVAFSIMLLTVQQASNRYSPRVVTTVFRDPFNRRVMALVVGTFTYCLVVLRSVRGPLDSGGEAVVPNFSVAVAVLLGIASILAVVAFINHNAHAMDISEILERVRHETVEQARRTWPAAGEVDADSNPTAPASPTTPIRFERSGWIQLIDHEALVACVPEGACLQLETRPGRYAVTGGVLCRVSESIAAHEHLIDEIRSAVVIGSARTMQADVTFGLRQLADVALRALSPGVNDPTTAHDAIVHFTAVLAEFVHRDAPPSVRRSPAGGWLVLADEPTHADLVRLAFDEVRQVAGEHPATCIHLLEALTVLDESLESAGLARRRVALIEQADLVLAEAEASGVLPSDLAAVRATHATRFGAVTTRSRSSTAEQGAWG